MRFRNGIDSFFVALTGKFPIYKMTNIANYQNGIFLIFDNISSLFCSIFFCFFCLFISLFDLYFVVVLFIRVCPWLYCTCILCFAGNEKQKVDKSCLDWRESGRGGCCFNILDTWENFEMALWLQCNTSFEGSETTRTDVANF